MENYIIAYDLGTGGIKASLFDQAGQAVASAFHQYDTSYPADKFHEQRPEDWWDGIAVTTRRILASAPVAARQIKVCAISGHSLGVVPVDREGNLLREYTPIWSDTRASAQTRSFFTHVDYADWYMTTGNGFPPECYAIFKVMWYRDHEPEVFNKVYKFLGTKDYCNLKLTGRMCTDYSNASGSGVYDLQAWQYKKEYLAAAGISEDLLPFILPSTQVIGSLTDEAAGLLGLSREIQVVCGGVDNACMALGAGCIADGMAYTSLGSSAWIAVTGTKPIVDLNKKPYVFTHCLPGMFVSSAAIFSAGNSFRWLRDTVCRDLLTEPEPYEAMTRLAAESPAGAKKLIFNPSLAGGSSLDRSPHIKGAYLGLQLGHNQSDLIRAAMEGICLNLRLALDVMKSCTPLAGDMLIVGGGGKSRFWRSLFADIYNMNIIETNIGQDAAALGAAALAAVGTGLWKDFSQVTSIHQLRSKIAPDPINNEKYEKILELFKSLAVIQSEIGDLIEDANW